MLGAQDGRVNCWPDQDVEREVPGPVRQGSWLPSCKRYKVWSLLLHVYTFQSSNQFVLGLGPWLSCILLGQFVGLQEERYHGAVCDLYQNRRHHEQFLGSQQDPLLKKMEIWQCCLVVIYVQHLHKPNSEEHQGWQFESQCEGQDAPWTRVGQV